jgi:murein L,D-transpeptidase YcbB/YkuD
MRRRQTFRRWLVGVLLVAASAGTLDRPSAGQASPAAGSPPSLDDRVRLTLRARIPASGAAPRLELADRTFRASPVLPCFYERRGFAPAWSAAGVPVPAVESLLAALAAAGDHGLRPEDYRPAELARRAQAVRGEPEAGALADLDLLLSDAFLTFAADLWHGKVNPEAIYPDCDLDPGTVDLATVLAEGLAAGRVGAALAGLAPSHPGYVQLRRALARYHALAARGGPAPLLPGPTLHTGDRGERVAALRARLVEAAEADAAAPAETPPVAAAPDLFDDPLAEAVRGFQRRHGLDDDGAVGPATLAELNQRATDHVRRIAVNLERWRWLPRDLGRRHVLVNIAAFRLNAVADGRSVLELRVVVGKPYTRTPVFSSAMDAVVLNPSWYVPKSIASKELWPREAKDPGYLRRGGYEVGPGRSLRQKPGPNNALGRIKFLFPNRFGVYLHDTPARTLFGRTVRAFSHGCIRIEKPLDLAAWVLAGDPRWTPATLDTALATGREQRLALPGKIPVHVAYWTAWVDTAGTLHLGPDVYRRDDDLARRLAADRAVLR